MQVQQPGGPFGAPWLKQVQRFLVVSDLSYCNSQARAKLPLRLGYRAAWLQAMFGYINHN